MVLPGLVDLIHFLVGTTPVSSEQREAAELVSTWLEDTAGGPVQWHCPRSTFGARLTQLVLEPWRLRQGSYGWCLPAAFVYAQLRRFPKVMAQFAIDLYETGSGSIGDMSITVPPELRAFDLQSYVEGKLAGTPLPAGRTKPVVYTHTDWIILGAVHDESNSLVDFEGPIDDYGAAPATSKGSCHSLFSDTGHYAQVKKISFGGQETVATAMAKLNASAATDIVLFGRFSYFTSALPNPVGGFNAHAVTLVAPPVAEGGSMKFSFFSWGDEASVLESISHVTGGLELTASDSDFGPSPVSNIDGAVVARVA